MKKIAIALVLIPSLAFAAIDCASIFGEKSKKPLKAGQNAAKHVTGTELNAVQTKLLELCNTVNTVVANQAASGGGVYPVQAPSCSSCAPTSGTVGTEVTCSGGGLATTSSIKVNGTEAATRSTTSDGQVKFTVAAGTTSGAVVLATDYPTPVTCSSPASFTVIAPVEVPGVVTYPTVDSVTPTTVQLSWAAPEEGTPTSYKIEAAPDASGVPGTWLLWMNQDASDGTESAMLFGLSPATKYWFRIYAVNASGAGPASQNLTATTTIDPFPPTQPAIVKFTQPTQGEPALGASVANTFGTLGSTFNTTTKRVFNSRHHYSKNSPWNADGSLVWTCKSASDTQCNGWGQILDGSTYALKAESTGWPSDYKTWGNSLANKNVMFGTSNTSKKWKRVDINPTTGAATVTDLHTYTNTELEMPALYAVSYGLNEGNMDDADQYAALVGADTSNHWWYPFVINVADGSVRCLVDDTSTADGFGVTTVSDATISHDGQYLIVNYSGDTGLDVYSTTPVSGNTCPFIRRVATNDSHYDACVSAAGDQVIVQQYNNKLVMYQMDSGTVNVGTTIFTDTVGRHHVSCRATGRPGWVYVAPDGGTCDGTLTTTGYLGSAAYKRIFAVKLDASGAYENWGWSHDWCPANGTSYDAAPMPVPSRDGKKVWFKANWDKANSVVPTIHSFVITRQ